MWTESGPKNTAEQKVEFLSLQDKELCGSFMFSCLVSMVFFSSFFHFAIFAFLPQSFWFPFFLGAPVRVPPLQAPKIDFPQQTSPKSKKKILCAVSLSISAATWLVSLRTVSPTAIGRRETFDLCKAMMEALQNKGRTVNIISHPSNNESTSCRRRGASSRWEGLKPAGPAPDMDGNEDKASLILSASASGAARGGILLNSAIRRVSCPWSPGGVFGNVEPLLPWCSTGGSCKRAAQARRSALSLDQRGHRGDDPITQRESRGPRRVSEACGVFNL